MQLAELPNNEAAILIRLLAPNQPTLSPDAARAFLAMSFSPMDRDRINSLAAKARAGTLTTEEQTEIEAYSRVGSLISILKSKARRSQKGQHGASATVP